MKLKKILKNIFLQTEIGYRLFLKYKWGVNKTPKQPSTPWKNTVLKTQQEVDNSLQQIKTLGLFPHIDPPKNWDNLAALDCILKNTNKDARILDAGAELYSVILPWLFLYGYRNLTGINLTFNKQIKRGPIHYQSGDITNTSFKDEMFDAITCLSVIEHCVNPEACFKEMSRILKPKGILIISTDYYTYPIDSRGQMAYGVPIHIFSRDEIIAVLNTANKFDLEQTGPISLNCQDKVVTWKEYALEYTFLTFTLQKKNK